MPQLHDLFAERMWAAMPEALGHFFSAFRHAEASDDPGRPLPADASPPHGEERAATFGVSGGEERPYELCDGVAVIPVMGMLTPRRSWSWGYGYTTGMLDQIRPAIAAALADRGVRAILLDVASPGGTVAGMKELADYIGAERAKGTKPMAAYANGLMASAAYMIGSATGRVLAPATATVGSIGVISVYEDWSKWNEKAGLSYAYLTAGQWKAVGNPDTPLADNERAYLQERLTALYRHFTDGVSASMGLDAANLTTWADGKVFVASEAPQGLVTAIVADREAAIATLAKEMTMDRANLASQHPELLASIEREAAEKAVAAARTQFEEKATTGLGDKQQACLAAVRAVAGDEAASRVQALLEQNLSASQIEAVASLLPKPAAQATTEARPRHEEPSASHEERILAGIVGAHAAPLSGVPGNPGAETPAQFGQRMAGLLTR